MHKNNKKLHGRGAGTRALLSETVAAVKHPRPGESVLNTLLSDSLYLYSVGKLSLESLLEDVYLLCKDRKVKPEIFVDIAVRYALAVKRHKRTIRGNKQRHGAFFNQIVCRHVDQARKRRKDRGEQGDHDSDCEVAQETLKKQFGINLTPYGIRNIYQRSQRGR